MKRDEFFGVKTAPQKTEPVPNANQDKDMKEEFKKQE